jgi:hypothetical protein
MCGSIKTKKEINIRQNMIIQKEKGIILIYVIILIMKNILNYEKIIEKIRECTDILNVCAFPKNSLFYK